MKQKRALRVLTPDRPLKAGNKELVELCFKVPDAVQIIESKAVFEGRCRASFSGQDSSHTLVDETLNVPFENISLPTSKGFDVIPEGHHRLPVFFKIPSNLPGTFTAKWGAIAYRFIFKLKVKRFSTGDEGTIECDKTVEVLGKVYLHQQPSYGQPVVLDRHVKKKMFFMNRLDANVRIELDRAAFTLGEHILVSGKIHNQHPSIAIKHVGIELRQHLLYASGDAHRNDSRLITRLIIGSVAAGDTFQIHHSLRIPYDCYPSLIWNGNPIQVTYEILLINSGNFEIGIPIFIGNCGVANRRSIMSSDSDQVSTYYCIPPSEFSVSPDPPPYSTFIRPDPVFIPIHMLKTPYRPFGPTFSGPGIFQSNPPKYDHNYNLKDSPPPQRFLKIEEITDE